MKKLVILLGVAMVSLVGCNSEQAVNEDNCIVKEFVVNENVIEETILEEDIIEEDIIEEDIIKERIINPNGLTEEELIEDILNSSCRITGETLFKEMTFE